MNRSGSRLNQSVNNRLLRVGGLTFALAAVALAAAPLHASPPSALENVGERYQPLNQNSPPGMASWWAAQTGRATPGYFQPIRISLPTTGQVTVYQGPHVRPVTLAAPAQVGVHVGFLYRVRISDMPEHPGLELFPTVEMLDHLHPPAGLAEQFPVPIEFTPDEIAFALDGRLITKVVFLEKPQHATPRELPQPNPALDIPFRKNLIAEAGQVGRPIAIVRLGGRVPNPRGEDPAFFGTGAPVRISAPPARPTQPAKP